MDKFKAFYNFFPLLFLNLAERTVEALLSFAYTSNSSFSSLSIFIAYSHFFASYGRGT
jgi:hypothetical protein